MKFKNILLMLAVLTVFFVGCARQPRVIPQVTPQRTTIDTPNVVPGTEYPETSVRQGTERGMGTEYPDTSLRQGTGTDMDMGMGTDTGIGTDNKTGEKTGAAAGKDTGKGMGTGTGTESKVGTGGSLENGIFNGDLYVSKNNFRLIDTTVNGNVYFTTNEAKSTFTMDATSRVTGRQEIKK